MHEEGGITQCFVHGVGFSCTAVDPALTAICICPSGVVTGHIVTCSSFQLSLSQNCLLPKYFSCTPISLNFSMPGHLHVPAFTDRNKRSIIQCAMGR